MTVKPTQSSEGEERPSTPPAGKSRQRVVLLAEDDDTVRALVVATLEQAGFVVCAAADGRAAGELFAADPQRFDLVLTDVIMPHAMGTDLAARVRQVRPNLPVLFMSAFPGGAGIAPEPLPVNEALLEKPFTMATLLAAVRQALGEGA